MVFGEWIINRNNLFVQSHRVCVGTMGTLGNKPNSEGVCVHIYIYIYSVCHVLKGLQGGLAECLSKKTDKEWQKCTGRFVPVQRKEMGRQRFSLYNVTGFPRDELSRFYLLQSLLRKRGRMGHPWVLPSGDGGQENALLDVQPLLEGAGGRGWQPGG